MSNVKPAESIAAAICATWPRATPSEIVDRSEFARVHAARVEGDAWEPTAAPGRWSATRCGG